MRGFPTLQFMDAEGNTLHTVAGSARSVAAFERMLRYLPQRSDLRARVEKGETGLEADLFIAEFAMGGMKWPDASEKLKALPKLSPAQKKDLAPMLVDAEIYHLARNAGRDPDRVRAAGERIAKILASGARPSKAVEGSMWSFLLRYADQKGDAELYAKAVAYTKKRYADREVEGRLKSFLEGLDARLKELQEADSGA